MRLCKHIVVSEVRQGPKCKFCKSTSFEQVVISTQEIFINVKKLTFVRCVVCKHAYFTGIIYNRRREDETGDKG